MSWPGREDFDAALQLGHLPLLEAANGDKERTFKLTEDIRYFDSTGKAVAVDVFRSGHLVLIIEREGMLKEMHQDKDKTDKSTTEPKKDKGGR